jgi:D-alanine-D-alanine ligase
VKDGGQGRWLESDEGVLGEAAAAEAAMSRLGIPHRTAGVGRAVDLAPLLAAAPEEVIFNLVEGFQGCAADACCVPSVCRAFGKACTGSDSPCLSLTQDKWRAKAVMQAAGLPVPDGALVPLGQKVPRAGLPAGPYIVKPVGLDASEGIDAASVVPKAEAALGRAVDRVHREFGQPALVEQFVGGQELNVGIVQRGTRVEALPIAEIDFSAFPPGKPRIVGYAAKWLEDAFEFRNTPRLIPARLTARQAASVRRLALAAWQATGCRGYARVDLRLEKRVGPRILEVNPNPDITPGDGFAAALEAAGIPYDEFIEGQVLDAWGRTGVSVAARGPGPPRQPSSRVHRIRWAEHRDRDVILGFLAATGFFRPDELAVAQELLDDALAKGPGGHYQSFVAQGEDGTAIGWVCFGPTPCTVGTFDVYWIGVAPWRQGQGIGTELMDYAESRIRGRGGRLAVVETAGRAAYDPTRRFYLKLGYRETARIADFYSTGDAKVVYLKHL